MTLDAIVARLRNTPGHLLSSKQKITKNGKNNPFIKPCFPEKIFPQHNGRYKPWAQILKFLTRPNLYGVQQFDFKIFYINDKKAWQISESRTPPPPTGTETL
jgi:hypothetical protein